MNIFEFVREMLTPWPVGGEGEAWAVVRFLNGVLLLVVSPTLVVGFVVSLIREHLSRTTHPDYQD
jgi:hypothetical protein